MRAKADRDRASLRRTAVIVAAALVLPAALIAGVLAVGIVAAVNALGDIELGPDFNRQRLDPIPVPQSACRHLAPVRAQAAELDRFWVESGFGQRAGARQELALRLAAFETVLVAARAHVPPRVRHELTTVISNVRIGRVTTVSAQGPPTLTPELFDGSDALFNVSDLVGPACGDPIYDHIGSATS